MAQGQGLGALTSPQWPDRPLVRDKPSAALLLRIKGDPSASALTDHIAGKIAAYVPRPILKMFLLKNPSRMELMPDYWFQAIFTNQVCTVTQVPGKERKHTASQFSSGSNESLKRL